MSPPTTHPCPRCGYDVVQLPQQPNRGCLRARLSELDTLITALQGERDALQAESDAIVYPVLSLPPEITSDIFECCVGPRSIPSPTLAPLLLMQICREWRQIALASPRLWRSLTFPDMLPVAFLETWLSRAGDLPLDYCFYSLGGSAHLKPILGHVHQWRDVEFGLPFETFLQLNRYLGDAPLPNLRRIHLEVFHMGTLDPEPEVILIRNAPLLREALVMTHMHFELPWHQLTSLTLVWKSLVDCLVILACCPLLRHLDNSTATTESVPTEPAIVTLAHLESFVGNFTDHMLLEYLTLPRVEQVTLSSVESVESVGVPDHAAVLASFLGRSQCPLREFHIPHASIAPGFLRDILLALPDSVQHLTVGWTTSGKAEVIFAMLAEVQILPRLNGLVLRGSDLSEHGYQSLIDVLRLHARARTQSTAHLSAKVSLHRYSTPWDALVLPSPDQMVQLQDLVAGGMKIRLEVSGEVDRLPVAFDWT